MAKAKVKQDQSPSGSALGKAANSQKQTKKQKKKKFWKNHPKIAGKTSEAKTLFPLLPPKQPQEFSSNWKALQEILFLDHPKKAIRDTQKYKPFKEKVKSGRPSLKLLCEKILNVKVQTGEHCSVQDAQAAMRLYTMEKKCWEAAIKAKYAGVTAAKAKGPQKDKQPPAQ
ncbi:hypothetical protein XENTR_v10020075 [Xenopus tropicalis]|uniref:RNA exonuclease 4 n=1 Tax=Xenopus tropicalis TaxID=8364 RepID=A0A8J1IPB0_XENTR|nr:RNA exonuclease 4 [Xenopus tropicalis]KAE8582311.1 hypothetical protein XENTR_v10020075 [Xenopus tropicalis]